MGKQTHSLINQPTSGKRTSMWAIFHGSPHRTPASPPPHRRHAAAWAMHETLWSAESRRLAGGWPEGTGMWGANVAVASRKTLEINGDELGDEPRKTETSGFRNCLTWSDSTKNWTSGATKKAFDSNDKSVIGLVKTAFGVWPAQHQLWCHQHHILVRNKTVNAYQPPEWSKQVWWAPTILQEWGSKWPKLRPNIYVNMGDLDLEWL